jgi:hypothetical protein
MEIHDSLNNQFKLYNYIAKFNTNLLQYLDNNNIDINYYCFFSKVIDEKHYIITSQTTKRALNGHRLITMQDVEKDNNIFEYNDNLDIIFENIYIKVTSVIYDINDTAKELGIIITNFDNKLADNSAIDFNLNYDKNILESNITKVVNVISVKILSNFENLEELHFNRRFDRMISINILPNSLRTLTFGIDYNQIIGINVLPNSLQTLTFGFDYNQTININVLPNLLQTLIFGFDYNQTIGVNVLPNSLQRLIFGWAYNQTIGINVLSNFLQALTFGNCYNQTIGVNELPNSLQTLIFDYSYNQIINVNVLPNSLQTLTFSYEYNRILSENILPNSLKVIYFNFYGNKEYCKKNIVPQFFKNIVKYINLKN